MLRKLRLKQRFQMFVDTIRLCSSRYRAFQSRAGLEQSSIKWRNPVVFKN